MKPVAYEGTEPYLFVSYAHRDADLVFPVLAELEKRGYRLWYDDGIAPGSEWPEDIARHLDNASMVMAFVTPRSMASRNCRREINFSLSREKPFLSVVLEPTDMSLGMEMQLSAQQSILRYNYERWEDFVGKVLQCPDLAPCRAAAEVGPESGPEPVPAPAPEPAPELAPAPEPVLVPAPEPTRAPLPEPKPASVAARQKAAKKLPLPLLALAVLLVVAAVVGAIALGGRGGAGTSSTPAGDQLATSWGDSLDSTATTVNLSDKTFTQGDLETLASLDQLGTLTLANCDLSACDLSQVRFVSQTLRYVSLKDAKGVTSLDPFDLANMHVLYLDGTQVDSLEPLAGTGLTELSFSRTAVDDLAPLAEIPSLRKVDGSYTAVTSLDALAGLGKLTSLCFDGCQIASVPESLDALALEKVSLAQTGISDFGWLRDCTKLTELDLTGNGQLTSLDWLDEQNCATLQIVRLGQTGIPAEGLGRIASCTGLKELVLDGISLESLEVCQNLTALETLSAVNCGLTDVSALSGCAKLVTVLLACNKIADASALASMVPSRDTVIELSNNQLKTVAWLPSGSYRAIMLYGNDAGIALTIPSNVEAYDLVAAWSAGIEESTLANKSAFGAIYLVDCPKNQQLKVEDALGKAYVSFMSPAELWETYRTKGFKYGIGVDFTYLLSAVGA